MADTRAYVKLINPFGSGPDENNEVHQTSPAWVLTFVSWQNRDTLRVKSNGNPQTSPTATRDPLVVTNDCLAVTTTFDKSSLSPSVSATLVMTDTNYETRVAPGDFMFVNMLNWSIDANRVANQAISKTPINGVNDGFKGVFKVQSVRRTLAIVDPERGTKAVLFKIQGYAFTEFNNTIYFNPYLLTPQDPKNGALYMDVLGSTWKSLVNNKGLYNVQDIIALLIQSLVGTGLDTSSIGSKQSLLFTNNTQFFIPQVVGTLLNVQGAQAAKDIYNYLFGIQSYSPGTNAQLASGMNPDIQQEKWPRFFYTSQPCPGNSFVKAEYWNQVKTWSILNQYTNNPINELYTCFRVAPNGSVMPTVVFRQIPFTTEDYSGPGTVTQFLTLPRWKIAPALVLEQDIGRDEAARINFVQYFGRSTVGKEGSAISAEIAAGNYVYDINDVARSGLRPYVVNTQFDEPTADSTQQPMYQSPTWAQILGDALIGGHLKLNGSFTTIGIVDPIAVGDNWEFNGTVFHIEQVMHNCFISPQDGKKRFRTTVQVSSGVSISSSEDGTRYSEMTFTSAQSLRTNDAKYNKILPGVSDSQVTIYRTSNPDVSTSANAPFVQPNTPAGSNSSGGSGNG